MRTRFILLFSQGLMSFQASAFGRGYDPASFPSYVGIPSEAKPLFEALAKSDLNHYELVDLAKVPEAEPAMIELIQRILTDPEGNPEFLHPVLRATALRSDLSEAHQAWLRGLLRSKLGRTESYMEVMFKMFAPEILSKYPGPENEQLMIDYLKDKNVVDVVPGALDVGSSRIAMDFLGRSLGSARSIEPLRDYAKIYQPHPSVRVYDYEDVLAAISTIEEREKQRASLPAPKSAAMINKTASTGDSSQVIEPKASEHDGNLTIGVIVALSLLALGWLAYRKWRRA